jgi:hypothetical protein
MSKHSKTILTHTLGISSNLMGWVRGLGAVGGIAAVGYEVYKRIDAAANTVSGQRRESKGLGVSIGTLEAFKTAFGRDVDPDFMQQMLAMETDPNKRTAWAGLGLGNMSGDVGKDMIKMLNAEREFAKRTPLSVLGNMADAYGLPSSTEELMRLRGTDDSEWQKQQKTFLDVQSRANISDTNAKVAQDFATKMEGASKAIAAAWNRDMIKFMPWTARVLSNAGQNIADLLTNPLGSYTDPAEAKNQAENRAALKGLTAGKLDALLSQVDPASIVARLMLPSSKSKFSATSSASAWTGPFAAQINEAAARYNLPANLLGSLMMSESNGDPNATGPAIAGTGEHARGLMQFTSATAKQYGVDPLDPDSAVLGGAHYLADLLARFSGNIAESIAAYKGYKNYASSDAQLAASNIMAKNGFNITIINLTGGSATASVSALAAPAG